MRLGMPRKRVEGTMALDNLIKFEELLRTDDALQGKIKAAVLSFRGDPRDRRAVYDAIFVPLAAEVGLPHTYDDVLEFLSRQSRKLEDEELAKVAGGLPGISDAILSSGMSGSALTAFLGGAGLSSLR